MKTSRSSKGSAVVAFLKPFAVALLLSACTDSLVAPERPNTPSLSPETSGSGKTMGPGNTESRVADDPDDSHFNLNVILRGEGEGSAHIKFRQPTPGAQLIYLDTRVGDLEPNTSYLLQRAVDTILDGNCTGTAWLTLGKGLQPQAILTDDEGSGEVLLFRSVAAFPVGTTFDIHFRVVNEISQAVVLTSNCYQYTIR